MKRRRGIGACVVMVLLAGGCRGTAPVPPPRPPQPATAATHPWNDITWVRKSAEYQAAFLQTYVLATRHVEQAAPAQRGPWGVVLDADETIISNAQYQAELALAGARFTKESWKAWTARRQATPLPGAAAFLSRVKALGGHIAIVTNRLQSECADTEAVFRAHGLRYDVMLCRPDDGPGDKNPRFEMVRSGRTPAGLPPLEVVAYFGDNILDFPSMSQAVRDRGAEGFAEFGTRFFVFPNPMYGSWQ